MNFSCSRITSLLQLTWKTCVTIARTEVPTYAINLQTLNTIYIGYHRILLQMSLVYIEHCSEINCGNVADTNHRGTNVLLDCFE
jgi:hypothetical protein